MGEKQTFKIFGYISPDYTAMNALYFWNGYYFYFFFKRGTGPL